MKLLTILVGSTLAAKYDPIQNMVIPFGEFDKMETEMLDIGPGVC